MTPDGISEGITMDAGINMIFSESENLRSLLGIYNSVIFYDTETTGLSPASCRIIELAAVRISMVDGLETVSGMMDSFVRLPAGTHIPPEIVRLTGITDGILESEGIDEKSAASEFLSLMEGKTVMLAHNANFDLGFLYAMFNRTHGGAGTEMLCAADHIDTLTVLKDRKPYPHKLCNGIEYYGLAGAVQNTHRAIDDVKALYAVSKKITGEKDDLHLYANVFGFNSKYPPGKLPEKLDRKIRRVAQAYRRF